MDIIGAMAPVQASNIRAKMMLPLNFILSSQNG